MIRVGRLLSRAILIGLLLLCIVLAALWGLLASGHLGKGVESQQLRYTSDAVTIQANDVSTQWRVRCLFIQRSFCLDSVNIDELIIETHDKTKPDDQGSISPRKTIALPRIKLPIAIGVADVTVKSLRVKLPNDTEHVIENIRLSAIANGSLVKLYDVEMRYKNISNQMNGEITLIDDYPLNFTGQTTITDVFEERDLTADFVLSQNLRNTAVEASISGLVQGSAVGTVQPLNANFPVSLDLQIPQTGWPLQDEKTVQAKGLTISITGNLNDYAYAILGDLEGPNVPQTSLTLLGQINLERALVSKIVAITLDGSVTGSAAYSFKDARDWNADINLNEINPGVQFAEANGSLSGQITANGTLINNDFTLHVDKARVEGNIRGYPLVLDTLIDKQLGTKVTIPKLNLVNGKNILAITGAVDRNWNLNGTLRMPELAKLWPGLKGQVTGDLKLTGPLTAPDGTLSLASNYVGYNEIFANEIDVDIDIVEAARKRSSVRVNAASIINAGTAFSDIDLSRQRRSMSIFRADLCIRSGTNRGRLRLQNLTRPKNTCWTGRALSIQRRYMCPSTNCN